MVSFHFVSILFHVNIYLFLNTYLSNTYKYIYSFFTLIYLLSLLLPIPPFYTRKPNTHTTFFPSPPTDARDLTLTMFMVACGFSFLILVEPEPRLAAVGSWGDMLPPTVEVPQFLPPKIWGSRQGDIRGTKEGISFLFHCRSVK